jgi:hypothetical protein
MHLYTIPVEYFNRVNNRKNGLFLIQPSISVWFNVGGFNHLEMINRRFAIKFTETFYQVPVEVFVELRQNS